MNEADIPKDVRKIIERMSGVRLRLLREIRCDLASAVKHARGLETDDADLVVALEKISRAVNKEIRECEPRRRKRS